MKRTVGTLWAAILLAIVLPVQALASTPQPPSPKAVTADFLARSQAKEALALELYAATTGHGSVARYKHDLSAFVAKWGSATFASSKGLTQSLTPTSMTLAMNQYPEQSPSTYCVSGVLTCYCGPSVAESILEYLQPTSYNYGNGNGPYVLITSSGDWTYGQYGLAGKFGPGSPYSNWFLETNRENGETPWWITSSDWPMSMSFNYWSSGSTVGYPYYTEDPAPQSGHQLTQTEYNANLTSDIAYYFPLAADVEEYPGGTPYLNGHNTQLEIQHWVALYGYGTNGWYTDYIDPIYGSLLNGHSGFNVSAPLQPNYPSSYMLALVKFAGPHGGPYGIVW